MFRLLLFVGSALLLTLSTAATSTIAAEPKEPDPQAKKLDLSKLPPAASKPVDFARDVQPLLAARCGNCHAGKHREAGLQLDTKAAALAGGDTGKAIVPGNSAASPLVLRIAGLVPDELMPPDGEGKRLSAEEVGLLRKWIDDGANWPDELAGTSVASKHWAYVPPVKANLPKVKRADWPKNPIDHFVLARLEKAELAPSPAADPLVLLRRVSLDLIGLPPTPKEIDAFNQDLAAGSLETAYERAVDRLLASPRFGERWAALWLDLARYADTQGYEKDAKRTIWRYRDWVIEALNRDLPFDKFTIEQLAGDLLEKPTNDQLLATAFHRNTMTNTEGGTDDEEFRSAAVVDRVNTTFSVWMGTTMACAQCHSHKYDPFSQREYFQFYSILNNTEDRDQQNEAPTISTPTAESTAHIDRVKQCLAKLKGQPNALLPTLIETAKLKFAESLQITTPIMRELPKNKRRKTQVHIRGNFRSLGEEVAEGTPAVLNEFHADLPRNRLGMARWIVARENPLTGRVLVNRLWEQLFGIGIVETAEDFGTRGALPSHPELLDWLAVDAIDQGWSVKKVLKQIVMSSTYRQTSKASAALWQRDPNNRLLARGPRVRLSAEQVRDATLASAGLLSAKMYGPSVMPPQPAGIWQVVYNGESWATPKGEDRYRRAIYTFWRRTSPYPSMVTFDAPSREFCVVRRSRTNTPLQALVTMNDPAFVEAAQALARRVLTSKEKQSDARLRLAFRLCVTRDPSSVELARLQALLEQELKRYAQDSKAAKTMATDPLGPLPAGISDAEAAAWTVIGNVLLNLDETITKG